MASRGLCWVTALMLLTGCGPGRGESPPGDTGLSRLLTDPSSLVGWTVAEGPVEYLPGTLYEYLNGAALRYVAYGFRTGVHLRYQLGDDLLSSVTLDLFDMGGELGAFGIYRSGLTPGAQSRAWGVEGYRSGTGAAAWTGRIFVQAEADDDRPFLTEMLERLVEEVCSRASSEAPVSGVPAILRPLPHRGLVERSERYVARDLLGLSFLPGGVLATYEVAGQEAEMFFSDLDTETRSAEALSRFRAHQSQRGEVLGDLPSVGNGGFRFSDTGLGSGTVAGAGRYVVGIHGDLPFQEQELLLLVLIAGLSATESGA